MPKQITTYPISPFNRPSPIFTNPTSTSPIYINPPPPQMPSINIMNILPYNNDSFGRKADLGNLGENNPEKDQNLDKTIGVVGKNSLDLDNFTDQVLAAVEEFDKSNRNAYDYDRGRKNQEMIELSRHLIPEKPQKLYEEKELFLREFEERVAQEKDQLSQDIDQFLKDIIILMEKIKGDLNSKIDNYRRGLLDDYEDYCSTVEGFLKKATRKIIQSKTMKDYREMDNLVRNRDPLVKEIEAFREKKHAVGKIEEVFTQVNEDYLNSGIDQDYSRICYALNENPQVYKRDGVDQVFGGHINNIVAGLVNEPSFKDDFIIRDYEEKRPFINPVSQDDTQGSPNDQHIPEYEKSPQNKIQERDLTPYHIQQDAPAEAQKQPTDSFFQQSNITHPSPVTQRLKSVPQNIQSIRTLSKPSKEVSRFMDESSLPQLDNSIQSIEGIDNSALTIDDKRLTPTSRPKAIIPDSKDEIILKFNLKNPKIKKIKTLPLDFLNGSISCIQALDIRHLALGFLSGEVFIFDTLKFKEGDIEDGKLEFIRKKFTLGSTVNVIKSRKAKDNSAGLSSVNRLYCGFASPDNRIAVVDFNEANHSICLLDGHSDQITDILAYDDYTIISSSADGCLAIWNLREISDKDLTRPAKILRCHSNSQINSICLFTNKKMMLSAGEDCRIVIYELGGADLFSKIGELKDYYPIRRVSSLYKNSSFALAVSSDCLIKVWNIKKKE